jgi:hypothetical protein
VKKKANNHFYHQKDPKGETLSNSEKSQMLFQKLLFLENQEKLKRVGILKIEF